MNLGSRLILAFTLLGRKLAGMYLRWRKKAVTKSAQNEHSLLILAGHRRRFAGTCSTENKNTKHKLKTIKFRFADDKIIICDIDNKKSNPF